MERNPLDASNSNGNVECTLTRRQKSFSCSWCALDNGEKTLSYLLALSPPCPLSVPLSISRSLSFYRQLFSFRQPLSVVFYHSCLLAFVMTREGKEEEVEEEEEKEKK